MIGKGGVYDPSQSEPVYNTKRYVKPMYVLLDNKETISAQIWRGTKMFTKNPPYQDRNDFTKEFPIGK
jgi:hypothetical protein